MKRKKTKPKELKEILNPAGKSIKDPLAFRQAFEKDLASNKVFLKQPMDKIFIKSYKGQTKLGKHFINKFASLKGNPYGKYHLHFPWINAPAYHQMEKLFLHHPSFISPILKILDQHYYAQMINSWRTTQSQAYFTKTSDYYARSLPGTSKNAIASSQEQSQELMSKAQSLEDRKLQAIILKGYGDIFNNRWQVFGGSLFTVGYNSGIKAYGRLKSVPRSTLCNMNKEVKLCILRTIKQNHGLSFMEIDLKSCHAKIFENLFDWSIHNRADLPDLDSLWLKMLKEFWQKFDQVLSYDHIKQQIKAWPENNLKGSIKNQFLGGPLRRALEYPTGRTHTSKRKF